MSHKTITAIREFNRFYTAILGLVNDHILESGYSLTEARIIYEVANAGEPPTAASLKEKLLVDEGYMSRILAQFVKKGILDKKRSQHDGRAYSLRLTSKGKKVSDGLNRQSDAQVENLVAHLTKGEQEQLVTLVAQVKDLLMKK